MKTFLLASLLVAALISPFGPSRCERARCRWQGSNAGGAPGACYDPSNWEIR